MPQVSRNPLKEDTYKKIYSIFVDSVSKNRSKKEFNLFLDELLTSTEKIMLSKRLLIAYLLEKGLNYRQISKVLHVSTSTVNRVDTKYRGSKHIKKILKQVLKKHDLEDFLISIGISITDLFTIEKSKTKVWKNVNKGLKEKTKEFL